MSSKGSDFFPGREKSFLSHKTDSILLSEPLTHTINLFIQHGIVPDEMKIAREISIFKPDDQSLFTNYQKSFNAIPDEFQHPSSN